MVTRKTTARKTPAKTTARTAAAPVRKTTAAPAAKKAVAKPTEQATEKPTKVKKPKLVRDSFTIPKDEYAVIQQLKARAQKIGQPVKKSELLRAGIKLLAAQTDGAFKNALQAVPVIKTGRPKNAK